MIYHHLTAKNARLEGSAAYRNGCGLLCNPHEPGTLASNSWMIGWKVEERFALAERAVERNGLAAFKATAQALASMEA